MHTFVNNFFNKAKKVYAMFFICIHLDTRLRLRASGGYHEGIERF